MANHILRWVVAAVALLVVGPLLAALSHVVSSPTVSATASPLISTSPGLAFVVWLAVIALAGGYGLFAATLTTWRLGVACTGFALLWCAWGTPRLDDIVRASDASPVTGMALDGFVATLIACALGLVTIKRTAKETFAVKASPQHIAMSLGAVAGASLLVAFLLARSDHVGQALATTIVAGWLAGAAGRAVGVHVPTPVLLAGFPIAALLSPIIGSMLVSGGLREAVYGGSVSGLLRVTPIDWAAGVLIGFPVGTAQAESMIAKQHPEARVGAPSTG